MKNRKGKKKLKYEGGGGGDGWKKWKVKDSFTSTLDAEIRVVREGGGIKEGEGIMKDYQQVDRKTIKLKNDR